MISMQEIETHDVDVLVIGAGGAGLRAAIEARQAGLRTAVACKSLLGKAHTVMAEGGIAAALGNVWPADSWQVHFRDTLRGGKMLGNWRMVLVHSQEASDRVLELESWGAVFDRTPDGRIAQRDFGGHRYARLAHVGDRTGLEMVRTLQQRAVALATEVYMECIILRLLHSDGEVTGALGLWRDSGRFVIFSARAVVLATGGVGKAFQITSASWEYTGDGQALALAAGAELADMEFLQFHPTGMVWPPSVAGLLVTEGVRGDGGVLRNAEGRRFMFDYVSPYFAEETADTEAEADRWYADKLNNRRTPDLLPRDEVARAINAEVKAGRGGPHGGVWLDIASRHDPAYIRRRLPSMYHQFLELADVDITASPMEVGPTCHYIMGGVRVSPETGATNLPGLYAAGEVAAGLHGANRLGGNSLGDLLVFGRRAGAAAVERCLGAGAAPVPVDQAQVGAAIDAALAPFGRKGPENRGKGENPYSVYSDLQATMQSRVGIVRTGSELTQALEEIGRLEERLTRVWVEGNRQFNPGWHLALSLGSLLGVSRCIATAALARTESRGGHTRDDFPQPDPAWGAVNQVLRLEDGELVMRREPVEPLPPELGALFEETR